MTDMGEVISAVQAFADAEAEAAVAPLRAELESVNKQLGDARVQIGENESTILQLRQRIVELEEQIEAQTPVGYGLASHQLTYRTAASVYSNDALCYAAADYCGPSWMRDMLTAGSASQWSVSAGVIQNHFAKGRLHHLTVGKWDLIDAYDWPKAMARLQSVADMLIGVAGVNEADDSDNGGVSFSLDKFLKHQRELYERMKGTPGLETVPVSNGPIRGENATWVETNRRLVDKVRPYMDEFNFHWYPAAGNLKITDAQIEDEFLGKLDAVRTFWTGPIIITECGATSANVGGARQATIGIKLLDLCAEAAIPCTLYELADDVDPGTGVQQNFGAVESNGVPKPLANALAARTHG